MAIKYVAAGGFEGEEISKEGRDRRLAPSSSLFFVRFWDDGLLPKGVGSSSFDAEGVPRRKTALVTKGVLKAFLHNSFTANKEKGESTGNAERQNYDGLPIISISNLIVEPGKRRLDDMISEVDRGIIVRRFSGNVRPESGDFSGIAKQASYIEKGEIKYALKETMISGNAFAALKKRNGDWK